MKDSHRAYMYECVACGHLSSTLVGSIGGGAERTLDEGARFRALHDLRRANFKRILDVLDSFVDARSSRLLDIGCAHGWFLDAAVGRGYAAVGVEPDTELAELARARNHQVIAGYFPSVPAPHERFDVITFNDVFEHLDAPNTIASEVHQRLNPGGLVVVSLPSSRGALFRAARALSATGVHAPLDRMWQKGFPSPHRSYFNSTGIAALLGAAGFRELYQGSLPALSVSGLWSRLRYDGAIPLPAVAGLWVAVTLARPLLRVLPSDIMLHVFQRLDKLQS